jgi:hypothetical protein
MLRVPPHTEITAHSHRDDRVATVVFINLAHRVRRQVGRIETEGSHSGELLPNHSEETVRRNILDASGVPGWDVRRFPRTRCANHSSQLRLPTSLITTDSVGINKFESSFRVKNLMQAHIVAIAAPQTAEDICRYDR